MCWYSDEEYRKHDIKTCMPLYSQDDGATFGWRAEHAEKLKQPDKPTLEDFKENGRYCKSGLAYPAGEYLAVCTSFSKMMYYDDEEKKSTELKPTENGAYKCNPEKQQNVCQLHFNIAPEHKEYTEAKGTTRGYVENQCKCALDGGADSGYCSATLGTDKYTKAVQALLRVNTLSNCHTMDRFNMRAQKDKSCGIGKNNDEWRFAVD